MNKKSNQKILLKLSQSQCLKCLKAFKPQEEVVMLKNSSMLHKVCYERLMKQLKKDVQSI